MTICLFLGPTLTPGDAADVLDARYMPPVQHGDVYRAVTLLQPRAIGIIDGYFQSVPSVWHKELLWAISRGVHVFGAASMGALRAAELAPYGMHGVGRIFEAYRDGALAGCGHDPFEDDDEVAVAHGPSETGYVLLSEAMVNIRVTLAAAEREAIIDAATREALVAMAKARFFTERTYEATLGHARRAALPEAQLAALHAWLPMGRVNQKRADALAMLETMRRFLETESQPARATFSFERTTLWETAVAALQLTTLHEPEEAQVIDELRVNGRRFYELRREVLDWLIGLPASHAGGMRWVSDTSAQPQGAVDDSKQPLEELARRRGFESARVTVSPFLLERQMLVRLRATGEYRTLLARAQDKDAKLSAARAELPHADEYSELRLLQLTDWYFTQMGWEIPDDLVGYLLDCGFPDDVGFHEAIFAEYAYRRMADGDGAEAGETLARV